MRRERKGRISAKLNDSEALDEKPKGEKLPDDQKKTFQKKKKKLEKALNFDG